MVYLLVSMQLPCFATELRPTGMCRRSKLTSNKVRTLLSILDAALN